MSESWNDIDKIYTEEALVMERRVMKPKIKIFLHWTMLSILMGITIFYGVPFKFFIFLKIIVVLGVHCDIYQSSYNIA
jgi:hypothetical protein